MIAGLQDGSWKTNDISNTNLSYNTICDSIPVKYSPQKGFISQIIIIIEK